MKLAPPTDAPATSPGERAHEPGVVGIEVAAGRAEQPVVAAAQRIVHPSLAQGMMGFILPLLAIPLFTFAGYMLAESGASRRLVRLFTAWTGHWRGGAAVAATGLPVK